MVHVRCVLTLTLFLVFTVGCSSAVTVSATVEEDEASRQPQHVHLSFGEAVDQMAVVWATNTTCDTQVTYGTSPWHIDQSAAGRVQTYTEHNANGLHVLHKAMLKGLQNATTYFYRPVCNKVGRGPFYFRAPTRGTDWSPDLLVVGDLGSQLQLLPLLSEESLSGQYSAILQLGGLSPYLADNNGTATKADMLMRGLERIAAFTPLMTAPGHNETMDGQLPGYRYRFSMPGSAWPLPVDKLWYSFNLGPVHFVSYCTDVYLHGSKSQQAQQYQWLVKDLSQANTERKARPWIVAFGHHPLYCSSDLSLDCAKNKSLVRSGLEETLYYYGVDLILQSHNHSYERLYPLFKGVVLSNNYTNPRAPVQIITGAASATPAVTPVPSVTTTTTPSAKAAESSANKNASSGGGGGGGDSSSGGSKKNSATIVTDSSTAKKDTTTTQTMTAFKFVNGTQPTYGRLHIVNATHAHWELLAGSAEGGRKEKEVLDSVWVVQEKHGKFQLKDLPDDVEEQIDQNLVANGGQPGVLNVHDPETETKNMLAADDSRRLIIGASFGAVIVVFIIIAIAIRLRRRVKRRSVRRWDVMDYKYGKTKLYAPTNDNDDDDDDDFRDDHDFEMDIPDGSMQTKKLINGK